MRLFTPSLRGLKEATFQILAGKVPYRKVASERIVGSPEADVPSGKNPCSPFFPYGGNPFA